MWVVFALASAVGTAIQATLSKAGMKDVDSSVAIALQAPIILVITWGAVIFQGKLDTIPKMDRHSLMYLIIGGIVTSVAYLFYFAAIKKGDVSQAAPVDRLSLVFSIILAAIFLKEKVNAQIIAGGTLMAIGAILIALVKPK